jgi:hypothetical protein
MNLIKTKKQEQAYDKTIAKIRDRFGSYHSIAVRVQINCGKEHTGQGFRQWIAERRIPTHIVFSLYEIMDEEIDPLTLCPWLGAYLELKKVAAR